MNLDLDAIKARCEAATPGPWHRDTAKWDENDSENPELVTVGWSMREQGHDVHWRMDPVGNSIAVCSPRMDAQFTPGQESKDAQFIAHARTDVPALVAEVERLTAFLNAILHHGRTTWPDTSCGRGGMGGQSFTTVAHSYVVEHLAASALHGKTLTDAADQYEAMVPGTSRLDQPPKTPRRAGPDGRPA